MYGSMSQHRRAFVTSAIAGACSIGLGRVRGVMANTHRRIKIGQIGTGHAHASKLSVYRSSPDYEVIGIVEPDKKLRALAEKSPVYQGVKWMSQAELLETPGLEAVLVETRVRDLLSTAHACVTAGKHIHLDKPAGESLPQFKQVLDLAAKQKLLVQMGYMYRYNPGVVLLRQFLKQGWLGEIFEIHTVMSKVIGREGRRDLEEYRGGMMFELGCHIMDLVLGIMGKPQSIHTFNLHSSRNSDSLLDNMLAVLNYPRATATVKTTCLEVDGGERRHLVVCGTEGTFHIQPLDAPAVRLTLSTPHEKYRSGYQDIVLPKYTRYVDDAVDMARIIRGEKETDFPYEHDLAVQSTVLQACGMPLDA